ncbi:MAG: hypothetical protein JWL97_4317 [Gemmatimonadales bacterium]|nr:hypothetical protein [Gemmatimonadales bacterium]
MKLKLTQDGHAVVSNGMPVYVHSNGREEAFDAPTAMKMLVGEHFKTSKVAGGLKIPHEIAAAAFGGEFRIERGQLVAYNGDIPVYSHTRYGEVANFDEALAQIVERYPNKDMIVRKDGAAPDQQSRTGPTITRAQFDAMPQDTRGKFLNEGGRIGDGAGGPAPGAPSPDQQGGKVMTRAQFDVMPNNDRAAYFKTGGKVVD